MRSCKFVFSVVIPSFNDLRILETIKSIDDQSLERTDIEVIIMDGGSEVNILNKIKESLKETDTIISEPDNGIFDGINKGIAISQGEIIFTLGSDDKLSHREALEDINSNYNGDRVDYLCSDLIYTDENWKPIRYWESTKPQFLNFLIGKQTGHFAFSARKSVYEEIGYFNISLSVSADFDFFLRLGKSNLIGKEHKKVVTFMKLGGNSSKNFKNILLGNLQMFKVAARYYGPLALVHFFLKPFWKYREFKRAEDGSS